MKSKKFIQFESDWNAVTLCKVFEIPVIDKRTNKPEYIVFDISISGYSFIAHHESLNTKQENSKKISFVKVVIDTDFSIDSNLEELYSECIQAIIESDFFELTEN